MTAASARQPGPQAARLVGSTVTGVEAPGKNLLIRFDNGLEIRTHLGMHGSWHRYRPGERWRRPPARARLVLEVEGSVAVCFDAPTVELFEQRAEALHPSLSALGPDLLRDPFDMDEAIRRLRDPARADMTIAEALLDQRALGGHRQRLQERGAVHRAGVAVHAGPGPRRRDADAARRDGDAGSSARTHSRRPATRRAGDDWTAPTCRRPALGLRPIRPSMPPMWTAVPSSRRVGPIQGDLWCPGASRQAGLLARDRA